MSSPPPRIARMLRASEVLKNTAVNASLARPGEWFVARLPVPNSNSPYLRNTGGRDGRSQHVSGFLHPHVAALMVLAHPDVMIAVAELLHLEATLHIDDPGFEIDEDPLCDTYPFVEALAETVLAVHDKGWTR